MELMDRMEQSFKEKVADSEAEIKQKEVAIKTQLYQLRCLHAFIEKLIIANQSNADEAES